MKTLKKKPADKYRHGDLANALLDAAGQLVAKRHGPDFSLRELADLVGVSQPAVYRHFESREQLLSALAARTFSTILSRFKHVRDVSHSDFAAWSHGLAKIYFETVQNAPGAYRVMFAPNNVEDAARDAAAMACFQELVQCYEKGQTEGRVRTDFPAPAIASCVWAGLHGMATLMLDKRLPSDGAPQGLPRLADAMRLIMAEGWIAR